MSVVLSDLSFSFPNGRVVLSHLSASFNAGRTGLIGAERVREVHPAAAYRRGAAAHVRVGHRDR